jgi:hypothetical protein
MMPELKLEEGMVQRLGGWGRRGSADQVEEEEKYVEMANTFLTSDM